MKRRDILVSAASMGLLAACNLDTTSNVQINTKPDNTPGATNNTEIPMKVAHSLGRAGLNLTGDWHGNRAGRYPGNLNSEIETALNDGFKHLTFITGADDFLDYECTNSSNCINYNAVNRRINPILNQIRHFSARYPDRVFVISLKGYRQVGGWDAPGVKQSYFSRALEGNESMQDGFVNLWNYISEISKDIPSDTLVFCLQNEPEWHTYHNRITVGRDKWAEIATRSTDAIRSVKSDRIIICEAVDKGLWTRSDNSTSKICKTINRSGVIYGFHYYGPGGGQWAHQIDDAGQPYTNFLSMQVTREINSLIRWKKSNDVPVLLSEMGAWGPYFEGNQLVSGATAADRAKWARDVVDLTFPENIGITWWGLNEHNTPYQRLTYDEPKIQPRLIKDSELWSALRL